MKTIRANVDLDLLQPQNLSLLWACCHEDECMKANGTSVNGRSSEEFGIRWKCLNLFRRSSSDKRRRSKTKVKEVRSYHDDDDPTTMMSRRRRPGCECFDNVLPTMYVCKRQKKKKWHSKARRNYEYLKRMHAINTVKYIFGALTFKVLVYQKKKQINVMIVLLQSVDCDCAATTSSRTYLSQKVFRTDEKAALCSSSAIFKRSFNNSFFLPSATNSFNFWYQVSFDSATV